MLEQAAATGIKQLPKAFNSLWSGTSSLISKSDFLNFSQRYRSYLLDNFSYVKVLGMQDRMQVKEIYTELRFLKEIPSRKYKSFDDLEKRAKKSVENWHRNRIETQVELKIEDDIRRKNLSERLEPLDSKLKTTRKENPGEARKVERSQQRIREEIADETMNAPLTNDELLEKAARYELEINIAISEAIEVQIEKDTQDYLSPLSLEDRNTIAATSLLEEKSRLLVLGKPGAGKSTFLKHILLEHLEDQINTPRFPLIVVLREFTDSPHKTILSYLQSEFETSGFSNPGPFIEKILRKKLGGILMLDGLDEVPAIDQTEIVAEVNSIQKKYKNLQIVVTSRVASYKGQLSGFSEYELSDLSAADIRDFAKNWFLENESLYRSFLKDITANFGLRELTTTPLLLTLLCISYKRNLRFPEQKSLLYLNCIDTLFIDWDSSRQVRRPKYLEHFDVESKKFVLGKVAYDTFCTRTLIMYKQELTALLSNAGQSLPSVPESGDLMLRELAEHHGVLIERSKGVYSFSHLTIQEFFNALHISKYPSPDRFVTLIHTYLTDERWRETIIFLAGLLPMCDQLLQSLSQVAKKTQLDMKSLKIVLPDVLPKSAIEFLSNLGTDENSIYWGAWLRCRLAEYQLNGIDLRKAGREFSSSSTQSMNELALAIQQIGRLKHRNRSDLGMSKPMNNLLAKCYGEIGKNDSSESISKDLLKWDEYFKLMELAASMFISRVRCSPEVKDEFVASMFCSQSPTLAIRNPTDNLLGI